MIDDCCARPDRQVIALQTVTIVWMALECAGSFVASVRASSLPVAAFGADSLVEVLSAVVVVMQFTGRFRLSPLRAARLAGGLLFVLAMIVVMLALFAGWHELTPGRTYLGMGITAGAMVIMPVLSVLKRRRAHAIGNRALAADAMQSATCAWLAAITLLSLLLQAIYPRWWIDSVAIACLAPLLLVEARHAWEGHACGCC